MATHSSILARKIPWTEELRGLQSIGVPKSQTQLSECVYTHTHTPTQVIPSLSVHLSMDIQDVSIIGYCEQCCYGHRCMHLFELQFCLAICPGVGLLDYMATLFLVFEELPCCFPQWLQQFTFPQTLQKGSLFSTSSQAFVLCRFLMMAILINVPWYPLTLKQLWLPKLFLQQESLQISAAKQAELGSILGLSITKWNTQLGLSSKCQNLLAFGHSPVHSSSQLFIYWSSIYNYFFVKIDRVF